ncbi:MAG: glyoxylase-like metal-dependent hydrolase (beta-lactamase superfamily II) [Saprospiraceae bacterium]|jgi:glyoxylase-like metal-dependent hydrolase (beta-lactamase superfamily II)
MIKLKTTFLTTGYTTALKRIAMRGGALREIKFHATCVLWEHPTEGYILFDTGYSPRFFEETKKWPMLIYAKATPVVCKEEWTIKAQLIKKNIAPEDIKHIIISHFHADHIAGLKDFPRANLWCSQAAWQEAGSLKGFAAVKKGIVPTLLPNDFESRVCFFEHAERKNREDSFELYYDIFDDASIQIVNLPGHARGQIGALFTSDTNQKILLAADAFWLLESLEKNLYPSRIVSLFIDNWEDYQRSFQKVRGFMHRFPEVEIISCHCPRTFERCEILEE